MPFFRYMAVSKALRIPIAILRRIRFKLAKNLGRDRSWRSNSKVFSQYVDGFPCDQNAIDLVPGWNCSFPSEFGLDAGGLGLFDDSRIHWALERTGSIEGKVVLEVGPLEGMHTYMLDKHSPLKLDAVEANQICYLRCLITSQVLKIGRARFHLGDINDWLRYGKEQYDVIFACGVLYHMNNPSEFLRLASLRTNEIFIWTHYYSEDSLPVGDLRNLPFSGKINVVETAGIAVRCYERSYNNTAEGNPSFCGGMNDKHYWLHRDDLLAVLPALGFNSVEVGDEDVNHPGGPCFSIMARREVTEGLDRTRF